MAISTWAVLLVAAAVCLILSHEADASLAVGRHMRPGRSLAVGRAFRPGRSLASGRPLFRPGKRASEVEESYMSDMDKKSLQEFCKMDTIDEYTTELIHVVKKMVDFERQCGLEEEEVAPVKSTTA